MNLVSHQCLSMRQNSEKMSCPKNLWSTRNESVSTSFRQPVQINTSKSSMLYSQVRLQGSVVDPEHPERGSNLTSFGKPVAGRFSFSGQDGKGEMGSELSRKVTVLPAVGNRVPVKGSEHSGRVSDSPAL